TARVYQVRGDHEKAQQALRQAVAVYEQLVEEFPGKPEYLHALAIAFMILADDAFRAGRLADARGYHRQAIGIWRDAVRNHPADVEAHLRLAFIHCLRPDRDFRDPGAAAGLARRAADMAPNDAAPWMLLGISYYQMGQCTEAITAFDEAFRKASGWSKR